MRRRVLLAYSIGVACSWRAVAVVYAAIDTYSPFTAGSLSCGNLLAPAAGLAAEDLHACAAVAAERRPQAMLLAAGALALLTTALLLFVGTIAGVKRRLLRERQMP